MVELIDLPDELLVMIFNKLNNVELLYSLIGINPRLDRIICHSTYTGYLTLFRYASDYEIYSLSDPMLDRFCSEILPRIDHQMKTLILESSSLERILLAADYPILHRLSLYNINKETAECIFADESPLLNIFKKKIQSLVLTMLDIESRKSEENFVATTFTRILSVFTNLNYFNCDSFNGSNWSRLSFAKKNPTFFSSTLTELCINVVKFDDCLHLLDGRLNWLKKLIVNVELIQCASATIDQKGLLPNMRCFSLMSQQDMYSYNSLIVPLVQRMVNLEELGLYINPYGRIVLDGNNLKNNIINHLPQLKKFFFNIRSTFNELNQNLSDEEILNSLTDLGNNKIISYIDRLSEFRGQCHYFSYPYTLSYFDNITNRFPDGLFQSVREVTLHDTNPFEHQFFLRLSQAFPFLERLSVFNMSSQQKFNGNKKHLPIIKYHHLIELDLASAHYDYYQQFLLHTKTYLPNNIEFWTDYECLKRATHNFKKNAFRVNCAKIESLYIFARTQLSNRLKKYFPNAQKIQSM